MTIRKNFLLDDEVAEHLEKIAKDANITQTQVVKNLIEEKYEEVSVKEKLEAFQAIVDYAENNADNQFMKQFDPQDNKIIQKVKAMME